MLISLFYFTSIASALAIQQVAPTATHFHMLEARETSPSIATTVPTGTFIATKYITIPGITNDHVTEPGKTITVALPTCIQTITPDENGYVPPGTCGSLWAYYPSFPAAIVFGCLFGGLLALHIWQAVRYKKKWCWVIIMATLWETLAFFFRAVSSKNQQSDGILLVFQIFILLAPLWINAFAYMTLGRMIYFFHPQKSLFGIPASTVAATFVVLDIVSFVIQLVGGGSAGPSSPPEEQRRGLNIYMGGIALQEFFIVVFMCLCIMFRQQMIKRTSGIGRFWGFVGTAWGPLLGTLLVSLTLITLRVIYRLVEFSGGLGNDNPLTTNEAFFYALESVPMFFAIMIFNITHPGRIITGPGSDMPGIFSMVKRKFSRRKGQQRFSDDSGDERDFILKEGTPRA